MRINKPISVRASETINRFVNAFDLEALPMFTVFLIVVTLGMVLNFLAMRQQIGDYPALLVSGLFEFSILGWKWGASRKKNNDTQLEIILWATWISVTLSVIMLTVNLFRTKIETTITADIGAGATMNGWEIAAYIIIGCAALTDIIAYLAFDQNDTDKEYVRINKRKEYDIAQRKRTTDDTIRNTEADLQIVKTITQELARLRDIYHTLPTPQLELILENARLELLSQYKASKLVDAATKGLADIDKDDKIAGTPIPPSLPAPHIYTLDELMSILSTTVTNARQLVLQDALNTPDKAYQSLKGHGVLPADLSLDNFRSLYDELSAPVIAKPAGSNGSNPANPH